MDILLYILTRNSRHESATILWIIELLVFVLYWILGSVKSMQLIMLTWKTHAQWLHISAYAGFKSHPGLYQSHFIFHELRNWCLQLNIKCFVKKIVIKSFRKGAFFVIVLISVLFVIFCYLLFVIICDMNHRAFVWTVIQYAPSIVTLKYLMVVKNQLYLYILFIC